MNFSGRSALTGRGLQKKRADECDCNGNDKPYAFSSHSPARKRPIQIETRAAYPPVFLSAFGRGYLQDKTKIIGLSLFDSAMSLYHSCMIITEADVKWTSTAAGRVALRGDGVVWVEIKPGFDQTPDHAQENLQVAGSFCTLAPRPILVDLRGAMVLTQETRAVYSDLSIAQTFSKLGMVVLRDPISLMMINMYMQVATLPMPMRVFSDFDKAVGWLVKSRP